MRLELELDDNDKSKIVGDVPPELDAIFKNIESTAHGTGYGKGVSKAAEEAKKQIADAVAMEKRKLEAALPFDRDRLVRLEDDYKTTSTRLLETQAAHDRDVKTREEAHARALLDSADALKKRNERIQSLTKAQLRGEAVRYGARDESLEELELVLHTSIGYSDDMEPFVRNPDGSARRARDGQPLTVTAFVKDYLDTHTHHRKPTGGFGGGARGGANVHGNVNGGAVSLDQARARVAENPHSADAINALFEAGRKKA